MRMCLLALAALMGVAAFGLNSAQAYYEGPWCAIVDLGPGSSTQRCDFRDFESCRGEITGGNRGFCVQNPRWSGASFGPGRDPRRRPRY